MKRFIISVLGKDRPGIIAAVTKVLFDLELNIEDVSQTILQNQFSGIFIASGPETLSYSSLQQTLKSSTVNFDLHFYTRNRWSSIRRYLTPYRAHRNEDQKQQCCF